MIPLPGAARVSAHAGAFSVLLFTPTALASQTHSTPADSEEVLVELEEDDGEPTLEERVSALEARNAELEEQLEITASEIERFDLRDVFPAVGDSRFGLGPAASKVYEKDQGLSIGGYGEMLYQGYEGGSSPDRLDFLRAVFYFGYKFNEHWVFNSEIEFEHASTGADGSASVEFAYLDYLHRDALNARVGLVLIPMGLINEMHEPTTYLSVTRPLTEQRIIPSTWRENGAGAFGEVGGFSYRAYIVNGLDAAGFTAQGLRGGRQKGSKALANDLAAVARIDWTDDRGLMVGGSGYYGNSGQGQAGLGNAGTSIFEAHVEYRRRGLWFRALAALAMVDDAAELNQGLGLIGDQSVGERQYGYYGTLGYDVMPHIAAASSMSLSPFLRYEHINTQAEVPDGYSSDPSTDNRILAFGLDFKPIDQIVFKASYQDWADEPDRIQALVGYVF